MVSSDLRNELPPLDINFYFVRITYSKGFGNQFLCRHAGDKSGLTSKCMSGEQGIGWKEAIFGLAQFLCRPAGGHDR